jgi:hypothetical protein
VSIDSILCLKRHYRNNFSVSDDKHIQGGSFGGSENGKGILPGVRYSQTMVFGPTFLSQMTMLAFQVEPR